jgi:hypothetical protein
MSRHFAAHTVVPESVALPLKSYSNNTCATRNLLRASAKTFSDYELHRWDIHNDTTRDERPWIPSGTRSGGVESRSDLAQALRNICFR